MASLLLEPNTFGEKAQENGKHDLHSAWRGIGVDDNKMAALGKAIGEIVNSQDQVPDQLRKAATTILEISSALNSLNKYKKSFSRIIAHASILVVALWQSYKKKHPSLVWPPPKLRESIDNLVETIRRIHKLLKRKQEKPAKRIFKAYFIRNLRKFDKYHNGLDAVVSKINQVLEALHSQAQHYSTLGEQPAEQVMQNKTVIQRTTTTKNQRKEDDEDNEIETESKASGRKKNNVNNASKVQNVEEPKNLTEDNFTRKNPIRKPLAVRPESKGTKRDSRRDTKYDEDSPRREGNGKNAVEPDLEEINEVSEEEAKYENIPVNEPVTSKVSTKKKKPAKPTAARSQTAPPQSSGISFNNTGTGTMINSNIGNIINSNVSNVGNDNSVNHFFEPQAGRRRKPTYY